MSIFAGMTSFQVVRAVRKVSDTKRVGHAGTLDPLATGLLLCCIGREATKHIDLFQGQEKEYECTMRLGECTPSLDMETEVGKGVVAYSLISCLAFGS